MGGGSPTSPSFLSSNFCRSAMSGRWQLAAMPALDVDVSVALRSVLRLLRSETLIPCFSEICQ